MQKVAIKVTNVSKIYKLYDTPAARLKDALGLARKKITGNMRRCMM